MPVCAECESGCERERLCVRVCVFEPYRKFPVELILSFSHFSFFFISSSWEIRYKPVESQVPNDFFFNL